MNCPLCNRKLVSNLINTGPNDWSCVSEETTDDNQIYNHYIKHYHDEIVPFYTEMAILLPYRIENCYANKEYLKPYCSILKRTLVQGITGKRWVWAPILKLDRTVDIIKYSKMRNRIKTLIVMS